MLKIDEEHNHPHSVIMATQLLSTLQWGVGKMTEGLDEDRDDSCLIEKIKSNIKELSLIRKNIEESKRGWLEEIKSLSNEHYNILL